MRPQNAPKTRPEQQFFKDPAIDRLMGTVMALATELFVLQSRLTALEGQLGNAGVVDENNLRNASEQQEQLAAEAKAYSEHLLRPLLGLQDAAGPTD